MQPFYSLYASLLIIIDAAVLSGYYNLNSNNNYNKDNDGNNFYHKINNRREYAGNQTGVANSETTLQTQQQTIATTFEREVTGALQPPPAPPAPPEPQQQAKPPLQATLPPVKRYKSTKYAKPTINILPWNLRMRSQKEIRTEGLFAALNDCLYRTMHRYRYLAMVDLDEFIVPRHNDTLNELIK